MFKVFSNSCTPVLKHGLLQDLLAIWMRVSQPGLTTPQGSYYYVSLEQDRLRYSIIIVFFSKSYLVPLLFIDYYPA